jgi:hypothetical protein
MEMLQEFEDLGTTVAKRWGNAGLNPAAFADISTEALAESRLLHTLDPAKVVDWLMSSKNIPEQGAGDFGQPPINVFVGQQFYIEILYWLESTTSIHEHAFTGTFGVLHGSSVHSAYRFEPMKIECNKVMIGNVTFASSELLNKGDVRPIHPGSDLIHALFHLDWPSISLVIRTSDTITDRPQYNYYKPYLAMEDFNIPKREKVQLRMLKSLLRTDEAAFWRSARQLLAQGDPFVACHVLSIAYLKSKGNENWNLLLDLARHHHGDLAHYIGPCLQEQVRASRLTALRDVVRDPVHRFFLALLLNVPTREEVYKLVALRFPGQDPKSLVLRWLGEIFAEKRAGIRLTPSLLSLLDRMLEDPEFEHCKDQLKQQFQATEEDDELKLMHAWNKIQSVDLLRPLLT